MFDSQQILATLRSMKTCKCSGSCLKSSVLLNLWPSWDSSSNHWPCLESKLEYCLFHMLAFPFVRCSESLVGFHKTYTKKSMGTRTALPMHVCLSTEASCMNTLRLEGHPALFFWLGGGFLLPVNLSCAAHVAGWLWGHWQAYWGDLQGRKMHLHWADSTVITSFHRAFYFSTPGHRAPQALVSSLVVLFILIHQWQILR